MSEEPVQPEVPETPEEPVVEAQFMPPPSTAIAVPAPVFDKKLLKRLIIETDVVNGRAIVRMEMLGQECSVDEDGHITLGPRMRSYPDPNIADIAPEYAALIPLRDAAQQTLTALFDTIFAAKGLL